MKWELTSNLPLFYLISIFESTFAYSLDNGAFGVYFGKKKLWKAKNKDKVTSICKVTNPI